MRTMSMRSGIIPLPKPIGSAPEGDRRMVARREGLEDPRVEARCAWIEPLASVLSPCREVQEAYLFGSHARGRAQPHSDIDVAVHIDETLAEAGPFGYRAALTTKLMTGLGVADVDVLVLNQAPPVLYHRVLRDGVRVMSRDLAATTIREGQALSRYCGYLPQLAKEE